MYISPYCRLVRVPPIFMKFGIRRHLTDIITCVNFLVDRFRGYGVLTPPILPFPIDLQRRPYYSVALPCDTVIAIIKFSKSGVGGIQQIKNGSFSDPQTPNFQKGCWQMFKCHPPGSVCPFLIEQT